MRVSWFYLSAIIFIALNLSGLPAQERSGGASALTINANDKEIIQRITERPEYRKYLFTNESDFTRHSRSLINQALTQISDFIQNIFRRLLRTGEGPFSNTSWLSAILDVPIWETFFFILVLLIAFLIYKNRSKFPFLSKHVKEQPPPPRTWQTLSRVPDAWQELITDILKHYLSSINMSLQRDMSLRYCLGLLKNNQRDDSFINELVEFLEKWHFSTWQPDEKVIESWFRSIQKKANHFKGLKLKIGHEQVI